MHALEGDFCGQGMGGYGLCDASVHIDQSNLVKGVHHGNNILRSTSGSVDLVSIHSDDLKGFDNLSPSSSMTSEGEFPEDADDSDALLKFISHILMEEELDSRANMFQDALALQAFEKSFYDVLGQKYPNSPHKPPPGIDLDAKNPVTEIIPSSSYTSAKDSAIVIDVFDSNWDHCDDSCLTHSQSDSWSPSSGGDTFDGNKDSPVSILPISSMFSASDASVMKCKGGLEKFSQTNIRYNKLIIDLENESSIPPAPDEDASKAIKMAGKAGRGYSPNRSTSRKNHERDERDYLEEERSNKHSANFSVDTELSDMFDEVLLCSEPMVAPALCNNTDEGSSQDEVCKKVHQTERPKGRKSRSKKGKKQNNTKREMVDLTTLLTQCAQAVASYDQRTAREQLKQIRQHSSSLGDASQRLAHCFANGLEARLAGNGGEIYAGSPPLVVKRNPASDILKAYHTYILTCPFKKMSNMLANRTILNVSKKSPSLHIIDFGILYGFQWPCLIQRLSKRHGGPPKLRITGIELPQKGFRPAERVEETGRRLADYCRRFEVPFEYCPIAQKWETIRPEDLKIHEDEFLVVNCLYRFKNLLDETVVATSPRDAVLDLVRRINPNIFIHGVVNGTYNAPFFVTRFREALFHFSALFDMLEACLPREDESRMLFETEIYGTDAMNVIACEGIERFERPETYKQWQVRNLRAGFRQIPLNQGIMKEIREKVKLNYHKDFVVDENSHWMLQGWKGRIINALSCWKPA